MSSFERVVKEAFLEFLELNELPEGSISDGMGNKASVKKDKHGFYKIKITHETTDRGMHDV